MNSEAGPPRRVLVVEDDETLRLGLLRAFERNGYLASGAADGAAALRLAQQWPFLRATVDLRLPDGSGLSLIRALVALQPQLQLVVLTGFGSIATAVEAIRLGATHYLAKPADIDDIFRAFDPQPNPPAEDQPVWSLDRAEWEHIQRVLTACQGNISRAARALRIERKTLQRKLAKHPVPR